MELDLINPHVLRILITVRNEDTINSISNRISLSYGWTNKWVHDLAETGVFRLTRMNVFLNDKNEFYKRSIRYIKDSFGRDIEFHYSVLSLLGIKYAFTKTDSVFIWTKGGYNISRYREFYPIFIKIRKKDKKLFEKYCKDLGLNNKEIFYNVDYVDDFDFEYCDGIPVESLNWTIRFMEENRYNFEPALETIKEMYNKEINVKYKESVTNV